MVLALLAFVLFAGPSVYILSSTTNSLGVLFQNFIKMSFWTDPVGGGDFLKAGQCFTGLGGLPLQSKWGCLLHGFPRDVPLEM